MVNTNVEGIMLDCKPANQIVYNIMPWLLILVLAGCQSEWMESMDQSKYSLSYSDFAEDLNIDQEQGLRGVLNHWPPEEKMNVVIRVPNPSKQSASFERALWRARAEKVKSFFRFQGLALNQIQLQECLACSSIVIG